MTAALKYLSCNSDISVILVMVCIMFFKKIQLNILLFLVMMSDFLLKPDLWVLCYETLELIKILSFNNYEIPPEGKGVHQLVTAIWGVEVQVSH